MASSDTYDAVVVGGGPAGATAAAELAHRGRAVLLLDSGGRIKPCGGAIPPRLIADYQIPDGLLVAKVSSARIVAPSARHVDIPIEGGFVGMVDREVFDEWLRERAAAAGAERRRGRFERLDHHPDGTAVVYYHPTDAPKERPAVAVRTRTVLGADGANSGVARQGLPHLGRPPCVFAYHEIVRSPADGHGGFDGSRCDVVYCGALSPDFYGWVFPHGAATSVGIGSAHKGFSLRGAVGDLRATAGLEQCQTIRREGAPIPLRPLRRWDNGRDLILAGDAAGVVAPASGEGIYYAMTSAQLAAEAIDELCASGDPRVLGTARRRFMRAHGQVFWILGLMQRYWYANDRRRERFVSICHDRDVQQLTFDAYMNKRLVRAKPLAHARIFWKNIAHLTGLVPA